MPLNRPSGSQLAAGVALAVALAVVGAIAWAFAQQLALAQQVRAREMELERLVVAERARHDTLVAELDYVRSDEYAERWAREEAKMARPGEVVVVLVAGSDGESPSDARPAPPAEPEAQPPWADLWELVFGRADSP